MHEFLRRGRGPTPATPSDKCSPPPPRCARVMCSCFLRKGLGIAETVGSIIAGCSLCPPPTPRPCLGFLRRALHELPPPPQAIMVLYVLRKLRRKLKCFLFGVILIGAAAVYNVMIGPARPATCKCFFLSNFLSIFVKKKKNHLILVCLFACHNNVKVPVFALIKVFLIFTLYLPK